MNSRAGLILRLARTDRPDRRLDAEIIAAVLGPEGCSVGSKHTVDGWDLINAAEEGGRPAIWMDAADVPRLTQMIGEALSFTEEVVPEMDLSVIASVLNRAAADGESATCRSRAARLLVMEALQQQASLRERSSAEAA